MIASGDQGDVEEGLCFIEDLLDKEESRNVLPVYLNDYKRLCVIERLSTVLS
jgi:hypothetical protein